MAHTATGRLHLINYTGLAWIKKSYKSALMLGWEEAFPNRINANTTVVCPVEFTWSLWHPIEDEFGEVSYQLEGTDQSFTVHATGKKGRLELYVNWGNTPVVTSSTVDWILQPNAPATALPPNSQQDLKWHKNDTGDSVLELHQSNVKGFFTTNSSLSPMTPLTQSAWMTQYYAFLKDTPLNQLLLPGTQDSGCSVVTHTSKYGVCDASFLTQYFPIDEQLTKCGVRVLEIKPCLRNGQWMCAHYWKNPKGNNYDAFGGEGIHIHQVVTMVNEFTRTNTELVIIHLNDPIAVTADGQYTDATPSYPALFFELKELQHLYKNVPPGTKNITNLPLNAFLGLAPPPTGVDQSRAPAKPANPCVLIVVEDSENQKVQVTQPGVFTTTGLFPMSASRTLSQDPLTVIDRQLSILDQTPVPTDNHSSNRMVQLNWTIVQSTNDAFWSGVGLWNSQVSILNQSRKMSGLIEPLFTATTSLRDRYPNILMVDGADENLLRAVLAVNLIQGYKKYTNANEASGRPFWKNSSVAIEATATHPQDVVDPAAVAVATTATDVVATPSSEPEVIVAPEPVVQEKEPEQHQEEPEQQQQQQQEEPAEPEQEEEPAVVEEKAPEVVQPEEKKIDGPFKDESSSSSDDEEEEVEQQQQEEEQNGEGEAN